VDEAIFNAVHVLDHSLGNQGACQVTDDLMHLNHDCARWVGKETPGLDSRIDLAPLPKPVLANGFATVDPAAFHAVGPIDVRVHGRQHRVNVMAIERVVCANEQFAIGHLKRLSFEPTIRRLVIARHLEKEKTRN
jgi:hypothetical protein